MMTATQNPLTLSLSKGRLSFVRSSTSEERCFDKLSMSGSEGRF